MANVSQFKASLQRLRGEVTEIAGEAILENGREIASLLVLQQQTEHQDSDRNPLRPYSPSYRRFKQHIGHSGQTDFDLTGEFHGGMGVSVQDGTFTIDSPARTDKGELKSTWLNRWNQQKGGGEVMKLSEDKKPIVWKIIKADFARKCRERLRSG